VTAGLLAAAGRPPSPLEMARDHQDRAALDRLVNDAEALAAKAPNDEDAQLRLALAASYLAEVDQELEKQLQVLKTKEGDPAKGKQRGRTRNAPKFDLRAQLFKMCGVDLTCPFGKRA